MRTRTFVSRKADGKEGCDSKKKAWEEDGDNHNNEMKEIGGKKLRCFKSEEENQ